VKNEKIGDKSGKVGGKYRVEKKSGVRSEI
jgi:hypothetical protein